MAVSVSEGADHALAESFREAMRRTASGVTVLTTDGPAGRAGVTVSSFCSLSMEPPSIIACVHERSSALAAIVGNGKFNANVLAEGQFEVALTFSGQRTASQTDRFDDVKWQASALGMPAIVDALVSFDCELATQFEFGSHKIIVGRVREVAASDRKPLIYSRQLFGRLEEESPAIPGFM